MGWRPDRRHISRVVTGARGDVFVAVGADRRLPPAAVAAAPERACRTPIKAGRWRTALGVSHGTQPPGRERDDTGVAERGQVTRNSALTSAWASRANPPSDTHAGNGANALVTVAGLRVKCIEVSTLVTAWSRTPEVRLISERLQHSGSRP